MKFKYFLRGLGMGIIFASLVCIVAFHTSDSKEISDKEVIERAKKLGMVEEKDSVKDLFVSETTKQVQKEISEKELTTEKRTTEDTTETTTDSTTEDMAEDTTEATTERTAESTTQQAAEEQTTEKKTEDSMEQDKDEKENTTKTVTITIKGGMSSYPVCQQLQELGVIKDATDFDNYLIRNGYANRISVGTHTLTIGMTYEEIAIVISDPR